MRTKTTYFFLVPLILGLLLPATFIVTYVTAVYNGHITIGLTFISDAGSLAPESCIFAQLLNIAASLMIISIYVRYRQLLTQSIRPPLYLLKAGLWTGWISAFGISIVGNFQFSNMPVIHGIGALLCFGVGIISLWIQVVSTTYDSPERYCKVLVQIRFVLALMATLSLILTITGVGVAFVQRGGKRTLDNYHLGYDWFLTGCINEWLMALSMSIFIMTYVREARGMSITPPQIKMQEIQPSVNTIFTSEEVTRCTHKLNLCNIS